jgi:hypothetical protein
MTLLVNGMTPGSLQDLFWQQQQRLLETNAACM